MTKKERTIVTKWIKGEDTLQHEEDNLMYLTLTIFKKYKLEITGKEICDTLRISDYLEKLLRTCTNEEYGMVLRNIMKIHYYEGCKYSIHDLCQSLEGEKY